MLRPAFAAVLITFHLQLQIDMGYDDLGAVTFGNEFPDHAGAAPLSFVDL